MGGLFYLHPPSVVVVMKSLVLLLVAAVAVSGKNLRMDELEYGFCDGSPEPLSLDSIAVTPFPIVLASGQEISIQVLISLMEAVPVGARIKLNIVKEGLIPFPIPCLTLSEDLHIGSCEYDGQHLLEVGADALCPAYFPDGQDCSLPLNPGQYGSTEALSVVLPEIPDIIVSVLGSGTYRAEVHGMLEDGTEMVCLYVRVELTH